MEGEKRPLLWSCVNSRLSTRQYGYERDAQLEKNSIEEPLDGTKIHVEGVPSEFVAYKPKSRSGGNRITKGIPQAYTLKKHAWYTVYEVSLPSVSGILLRAIPSGTCITLS